MDGLNEYKINDALNSKDFCKNLDLKEGFIKRIYQFFYYVKILINRYKSIRKDLVERPSVVIVQREIFPKYFPRFMKKRVISLLQNTKVIWDFDDDIFLNGEISKAERELLCKYSNYIIGIGEYAKSLLPVECHDKFIMLPTTDCLFEEEELNTIMEQRRESYGRELGVVWVGTASNLMNLNIIVEQLESVALSLKKYGKTVCLRVVCNIPYKADVKELHVEYVKWSRESTKREIAAAHIGIMPLKDVLYAKGKGGFKLIQYMSSGLVVVSSDVGYCREIIDDGCGYLVKADDVHGWQESMEILGQNEIIWKEKCLCAYQRYKSKFDFNKNLCVWKELIAREE